MWDVKDLFLEKSDMTSRFWPEQMEGQSCHLLRRGIVTNRYEG